MSYLLSLDHVRRDHDRLCRSQTRTRPCRAEREKEKRNEARKRNGEEKDFERMGELKGKEG